MKRRDQVLFILLVVGIIDYNSFYCSLLYKGILVTHYNTHQHKLKHTSLIISCSLRYITSSINCSDYQMGARNTFQMLAFLSSCILLFGAMSTTSLEVGYYSKCAKTCPQAELVVKTIVHKYIVMDPGFGAGVIRMFFHDCFVRVCSYIINYSLNFCIYTFFN